MVYVLPSLGVKAVNSAGGVCIGLSISRAMIAHCDESSKKTLPSAHPLFY